MLFTDLVGSTELMAQLGDATFDRLRTEHFAQIRRVVGRRAGTEVKTTGDGILATFSSAVEAVAAAVDAQQATEQHGRGAGVPLALRVGLALGEVAFQDGDVFGTPVVEAARLVEPTTGPGRRPRRRKRTGPCPTPPWPATGPWPSWPTTKRRSITARRSNCSTPLPSRRPRPGAWN